jgi:uncharacterized membrane protein
MIQPMRRSPWKAVRAELVRFLFANKGQATAEYVSMTTILVLGALAGGLGWPYFTALINGLNGYVTSLYYTLNLAIP